jgi:hypothetical protein
MTIKTITRNRLLRLAMVSSLSVLGASSCSDTAAMTDLGVIDARTADRGLDAPQTADRGLDAPGPEQLVQATLWAASAGGTGGDTVGYGISVDSAGNTYVTGEYGATASFGPTTLTSKGSSDLFVAKLDSAGKWL